MIGPVIDREGSMVEKDGTEFYCVECGTHVFCCVPMSEAPLCGACLFLSLPMAAVDRMVDEHQAKLAQVQADAIFYGMGVLFVGDNVVRLEPGEIVRPANR